MWLLDTRTLRLHYFQSPEQVKEGYAVLSHVWDAEEQGFQDIQEIHRRSDAARSNHLRFIFAMVRTLVTRTSPLDAISPKIRKFCNLCAQNGYKWGWVDTCCIDKSSSAELSEAINSMFRYYSLALVCYVYLSDVNKDSPEEWLVSEEEEEEAWKKRFYGWKKEFQDSSWHNRGWTLQELIAPQTVLFFSRSWNIVGSRSGLAKVLERPSRVPEAVLRGEKQVKEYSIAERMSWAAERETTRVEDEAYCLMGLFNVNMPTLYGEGRKAFQRLQKEIMQRSPDTTLFAWDFWGWDQFSSSKLEYNAQLTDITALFARSPRDFKWSSDIVHVSRQSKVSDAFVCSIRPLSKLS